MAFIVCFDPCGFITTLLNHSPESTAFTSRSLASALNNGQMKN